MKVKEQAIGSIWKWIQIGRNTQSLAPWKAPFITQLGEYKQNQNNT